MENGCRVVLFLINEVFWVTLLYVRVLSGMVVVTEPYCLLNFAHDNAGALWNSVLLQ